MDCAVRPVGNGAASYTLRAILWVIREPVP